MNPKRLFRHTTFAALWMAVGAALPLLLGNQVVGRNEMPQSEVATPTVAPQVPAEVAFADEVIRLDRADLRERMDREITAFTYSHQLTLLMIKRANRYFPIVEPILKECGVPDDLKYLMVIESNLSPLAKSPVGAAGMWQFIQATGRKYGLEVNENIDERYNLEKATRAACDYLKESYEMYGDWMIGRTLHSIQTTNKIDNNRFFITYSLLMQNHPKEISPSVSLCLYLTIRPTRSK